MSRKILSAAILIASCAVTPSTSPRRTIVDPNGFYTTQYPHVVRVLAGNRMCTGTHISLPGAASAIRGAVLTANHCVEGLKPLQVLVEYNGATYPAVEILSVPNRDIALLATKLPKDAESVKLGHSVSHLRPPFYFVGFGCSPFQDARTYTPLPAGTKRLATFSVSKVSQPDDANTLVLHADGFHVCPGDSGGAIFSQGSGYVIAIAITRITAEYSQVVHMGVGIEDVISLGALLND